ncbi:hypothetical protein [Kitasatospora sp. NPDC050463]|uniref:hypothetical protein n=1 Tax=Kitasatospora sp. NPDC050463 TaxID=3155786 RepID=UPI0033EF3671
MSTPRPDSAPAPGAAADRTVRLATGPDGADRTARPAAEATVRLNGAEGTVRLNGAEVTVRLNEAEATVRRDDAEAASATFLDPGVWGGAPEPTGTTTLVEPPPGEQPPSEQPLAPGELRRFGPGVPPQAAAVWHGTAVPRAPQQPRPRRVWRWLVPVAVLSAVLAVLAFLFWRFTTPALAVTGVGVTTDPAGPGCGGTAVITAAVETDGGAGTVRYHWLRSDGTTSGEITQEVGSGAHRTDLVLRWSFEGQGSLQAAATLEILSPAPRTATASFAYRCP